MASNMNAKQIQRYLQRFGWSAFKVMEDDGKDCNILTGWTDPGSVSRMLLITVSGKQTILHFAVPGVVSAPEDAVNPGRLAEALAVLAFANYTGYIGNYSYDPRDGEVQLEYALAIDEAKVTFEQFEHIINSLIVTDGHWTSRIASVVSGESSEESVLKSFAEVAQGIGRLLQ